MKIPFGKYKGRHIEKLPRNYLEWIVANLKDTEFHKFALRAEEALKSEEVRMEAAGEDLDRLADEFLSEHGFDRHGKQQ